MPVLVLTVSEYLNELLEDCSLATIAALGKSCRVVVVAVDHAIVFIVAVFCAKSCRTDRAREMIDMILVIKCGYVGTPKSPSTIMAQKVKSPKVIRLTERVLATTAFFVINRKEF